MLSFILAESSLELIPRQMWRHNSVTSYCKKMGKDPSGTLLDNSWHFAAMRGIKDEIKRGRPDLVHLCLLEACSIPLYQKNQIDVYIHTISDYTIVVGKQVRVPKSYHRFAGIVEQLFLDKTIKYKQTTLFELKKMSFSELIDKIEPEKTIGLSSAGKSSTYFDVAKMCDEKTCLVVGGFPKGDFSANIKKRMDQIYSVDATPLEAHVVISRVLYEYEKTIFM